MRQKAKLPSSHGIRCSDALGTIPFAGGRIVGLMLGYRAETVWRACRQAGHILSSKRALSPCAAC